MCLCSCSVIQLFPTLCDHMNCSTRGLPILHCLPEFAQIHIHLVSDAIQPSHPLLSPSPPCPQSFPAWVFSNESALHIKWPNYWSFSISISNGYSRLISLRIDWFDILAVQIILCTVRTCVLSTACLQTPVWLTPWNIIVFWVSCHYCLFMKCP